MDPTQQYVIADAGTEEMWIDTDGTPYLYYTGPEGRLMSIYTPQYNYASNCMTVCCCIMKMQTIAGLSEM